MYTELDAFCLFGRPKNKSRKRMDGTMGETGVKEETAGEEKLHDVSGGGLYPGEEIGKKTARQSFGLTGHSGRMRRDL